MSNHIREALEMSKAANTIGEAEILRNENYALKQEIKELKRKLMKSVYGMNPSLYVGGRKND